MREGGGEREIVHLLLPQGCRDRGSETWSPFDRRVSRVAPDRIVFFPNSLWVDVADTHKLHIAFSSHKQLNKGLDIHLQPMPQGDHQALFSLILKFWESRKREQKRERASEFPYTDLFPNILSK